MCGKIKIPLRKSKNDPKKFPLVRKRARKQKFPHPQTAYNLRENGARHPLAKREISTLPQHTTPHHTQKPPKDGNKHAIMTRIKGHNMAQNDGNAMKRMGGTGQS
jgi:hypothetical protein